MMEVGWQSNWRQIVAAAGACWILLVGLVPAQGAARVTLAWDPNPEPDIAGYHLYYRESGASYSVDRCVTVTNDLSITNVVGLTNEVRGTVPGLMEGHTYFFVVTAFSVALLESDYSDEVVYTIPFDTTVVPPTIAEQPVSQVATNCGQACFSVSGVSDKQVFYQWRRRGVHLAGATNSVFCIAPVRKVDADDYDAVVYNAGGAVTSAVARLTVQLFDFGDAPGDGYATTSASAASHLIVPGFALGVGLDGECGGAPDPESRGDDWTEEDDEDGVIFTSALLAGELASVRVVASTNGLLSAWVDFAADGSWAQDGDQILRNVTLEAGVATLTFLVPSEIVQGPSFARFRFSSQADLSYAGPAPDGEVEDHPVVLGVPGAKPQVELVVIALPSQGAVGDIVTYAAAITNSSHFAITSVKLIETLSPNLERLWTLPTQGDCSQDGRTLTCNLGTVEPGASALVYLRCMLVGGGLALNSVSVEGEALGQAWTVESTNVTTTVVSLPVITGQPQSLTVTEGATAAFTVVIQASAEPDHYQWRLNGIDLPQETNQTLVIDGVRLSHAGRYTVLVSNPVGAVLSAEALLTVEIEPKDCDLAVEQVGFPEALAVGETLTYQIVVTNRGPSAAYDVVFTDTLPERVTVLGATSSHGSCRLEQSEVVCQLGDLLAQEAASVQILVQAMEAGRATNALAVSSLSNEIRPEDNTAQVTLTQLNPPTLFVNARNRQVGRGGSVSLAVGFTGDEPLQFQWLRNGVAVARATNSVLTLTNLALADAATYTVELRNPVGIARDSFALTVTSNSPPRITSGVSTLMTQEDV